MVYRGLRSASRRPCSTRRDRFQQRGIGAHPARRGLSICRGPRACRSNRRSTARIVGRLQTRLVPQVAQPLPHLAKMLRQRDFGAPPAPGAILLPLATRYPRNPAGPGRGRSPDRGSRRRQAAPAFHSPLVARRSILQVNMHQAVGQIGPRRGDRLTHGTDGPYPERANRRMLTRASTIPTRGLSKIVVVSRAIATPGPLRHGRGDASCRLPIPPSRLCESAPCPSVPPKIRDSAGTR